MTTQSTHNQNKTEQKEKPQELSFKDACAAIEDGLFTIRKLAKLSSHNLSLHNTSPSLPHSTSSALLAAISKKRKQYTLIVENTSLPQGAAPQMAVTVCENRREIEIVRHDLYADKVLSVSVLQWKGSTPQEAEKVQCLEKTIGAWVMHCLPEIAGMFFMYHPTYVPGPKQLEDDRQRIDKLSESDDNDNKESNRERMDKISSELSHIWRKERKHRSPSPKRPGPRLGY